MGTNSIIKKKKKGKAIVLSSGKEIRKLKKKVKKAKKKIKRLSSKRKGLKGKKYKKVTAQLHRANREMMINYQFLSQVKSCRDGKFTYDDYSEPGFPVEKIPWETDREDGYQPASDKPNEDAETAFSFDSKNYFIRSRTLHGTKVTVAIHNSIAKKNNNAFTPKEFADAIIDIFHNVWHVFNGFPFDEYVFKIRAKGESSGFSLSRGGVVLSASDYNTMEQAHEMIHAWNGKTFNFTPDGSGNIFQLETYITEEMTVYLTNRMHGLVVNKIALR